MSTTNPGEIFPLLNPGYWDGHMLGDGQFTPSDPEAFMGPRFGAPVRFAKRALEERLKLMHSYSPLEAFNKGMVFDPDEWAPGTVTLLDHEELKLSAKRSCPDLSAYTSLEVPARPTTLHPNLKSTESGTEAIEDEALGIRYTRTISWGVVAPTRGGRRALYDIPTSTTYRSTQGRVSIGEILPAVVPLHIGDTRHRQGILGDEFLMRVNILHVTMMGSEQRKKQKAPFRVFLGSTAIGNA